LTGPGQAYEISGNVPHSHSILSGGFDAMPEVTRLTPRTPLMIRFATRPKNASQGTLSPLELSQSEFVDRVEAGNTIDITRRGRPVARLMAVARPRKRIDLSMLEALTAAKPPQDERASDLVRSMRDGDRY